MSAEADRKEDHAGPGLRGIALLFSLSLVLAGPAIFLHELGHFLAGMAYGEDVRMTASSVVSGTKASDYPPLQQVVQTGMGPLVSVLLTLLGLAILRRNRHIGAALAVAAPARFLFSVGFLGILAYRSIAGLPPPSPSFDEYTVMSALALPVWPLLLAELVFLVWVFRTVNRSLVVGRKWSSWLGLVLGTIAGGFVWLAFVGPALLS